MFRMARTHVHTEAPFVASGRRTNNTTTATTSICSCDSITLTISDVHTLLIKDIVYVTSNGNTKVTGFRNG